MNKQIPTLAVSMVALSACNTNRVGLVDKIQDKDLVDFCEAQLSCSSELLKDLYLFYCVDSVQDTRHRAKRLGCETEFNEVIACEISEAETQECRSDYDDYDDWLDDLEESYYSSPSENPCADENDDYNECINDFMGIEEGATSPYYGTSTPYYGEEEG